jgi:hypothetical protein
MPRGEPRGSTASDRPAPCFALRRVPLRRRDSSPRSFVGVRHIYLDQNKWIDLARAVNGTPGGNRFEDVALVLRAGVDTGELSLPLSSVHYMETQNRREWNSRRRLGETMLAFSKLQTIAPPDSLLAAELDRTIVALFGASLTPRPLQVFGSGASHAFAEEYKPWRIPDEVRADIEDPVGYEREANRLIDRMLLLGPTPEMEAAGMPDCDPFSHLEVGERYAEAKEELRAVRVAESWNSGERSMRVARAQAITDHLPAIEEALGRAGLPIDLLIDGGQEGMSAFVDATPTILASSELERHRHVASQKPWERQDLNDIAGLSVAIAYCDIVVTEGLWTDAATRSALTERLGTVVISDLADLTPHLL